MYKGRDGKFNLARTRILHTRCSYLSSHSWRTRHAVAANQTDRPSFLKSHHRSCMARRTSSGWLEHSKIPPFAPKIAALRARGPLLCSVNFRTRGWCWGTAATPHQRPNFDICGLKKAKQVRSFPLIFSSETSLFHLVEEGEKMYLFMLWPIRRYVWKVIFTYLFGVKETPVSHLHRIKPFHRIYEKKCTFLPQISSYYY